jgi:hypothetical protein
MGVLSVAAMSTEYDSASTDAEHRYVVPESFLMSTAGCRVDYILTVGNKLLDAHEREVIKAGGQYTWFGQMSAGTMIGSKTTAGDLLTFINSGKIEHVWAYDN